ncbi:MAG TPA: cell division protein ZapA [Rhizomicrobium sp.]|nr:cell division protein ZapA [Rhizomicrobium sp.]
MPLVNVMVNGRAYTIACDDGEEEHLKELAAHVDSKVRELLESVGQVGDQRLLLMAAVLITDEFFDARGRLEAHARRAAELAGANTELTAKLADSESSATRILEDASHRIEALKAKLAA